MAVRVAAAVGSRDIIKSFDGAFPIISIQDFKPEQHRNVEVQLTEIWLDFGQRAMLLRLGCIRFFWR